MATKIRSSNLGQSATTSITNIVVDNSLDSSGVIALVDSDYVLARSPAGTDSATVISIIDSDHVQARANEAYIKGIADSAYVDTVIAGASITDLSDADQTVRTTDNVNFNDVTLAGTLDGPATFYIDPAPIDSDGGTVVIRGNLQVDGTETIVNSQTVTINDKTLLLGDSATTPSLADGAGVEFGDYDSAASIKYDATADAIDFNKDIDVTGTVTTDGLISSQDITIRESIPQLVLEDTDGTNIRGSMVQAGTNLLFRSRGGTSTYGGVQWVRNNGTDRKTLEILSNGGISFYADDGTTQGLRWDASTQRLGLGTTSPNSRLNLKLSSRGSSDFRITDADTSNDVLRAGSQADGDGFLQLRTVAGQGPVLFDASGVSYINGGNVGIGDTTPSEKLDVNGNVRVDGAIYVADRIYHDGDTNTHIRFDSNDNISLNTSGGARLAVQSSGDVVFYEDTGASRHFRWDASRKSVRIGTADSQMDYRAPLEINGLASGTNDREPVLAARSKVGASIMQLNVRGARWEIGSGGALDTTPSVFINANGSFELLNNGNNSNGNIKLGSDTNNTTKYMAIRGKQYASDTETEGYGLIGGVATSSANRVRIGGGLGEENAATQIEFITAGNTTTRTGTERMRIDSSGNVLVGKTSADNGSTVGHEFNTNDTAYHTRSGGAGIVINRTSSDGSIQLFQKAGTTKGSVSVTTTGTTYNTTSDIRLKTDIEPIADATDKLMAMNAVTHKWKADPDADAVVGFIAQEMQEIVPEAVSKGEGEDDMWSMDYGRITPVLVAALQDAHKKIEQLEQRIANMEAK